MLESSKSWWSLLLLAGILGLAGCSNGPANVDNEPEPEDLENLVIDDGGGDADTAQESEFKGSPIFGTDDDAGAEEEAVAEELDLDLEDLGGDSGDKDDKGNDEDVDSQAGTAASGDDGEPELTGPGNKKQ